jgi:Rne/Rng family ribonuclease
VNSGGNLGQKDLASTALQTNLEACVAIARHLRLRNIGGLTVIDFIDMGSESDEERVARKMKDLCASDRLHCQVSDVLPFGLLAVSRSRVGLPLDASMGSGGSESSP